MLDRLRVPVATEVVAQGLGWLAGRSVRAEYLARLSSAIGQRDPFRGYLRLCSYSTSVDRARALGCTEAEVTDEIVFGRHTEIYDRLPKDISFLRKAMALDLLVYLPGQGLAYADRAGMEE